MIVMRSVRQRLAGVALGWILCHACLLAAVPTVLCVTSNGALAAECTCDHGDGQMCPMHHKPTTDTRGTPSPATCSCRSAVDPMLGVLAALVGPPAVNVVTGEFPRPAAITQTLLRDGAALPSFSHVPDPPPPRA